MYKIMDWAGNDLTKHYGTFESFEEAWEAIYQHINEKLAEEGINEWEREEAFDAWAGEYHVDPTGE